MDEVKCCVHCMKHREYYKNTKDIKLIKVKEYREKNKEYISVRAKEKLLCECGGRYTRGNKSTHMKSKKHKEYESNKNSN